MRTVFQFRNALIAGGAAIAIAVSVSSTGYSQSQNKSVIAGAVDYAKDVHAILADHCLVCHNSEKRSNGLSLGTYEDIMAGGKTGAAVKPGDSKNSLLMKRLLGDVAPRMPFGGDPLSDSEIAVIRTWIDEGARETPTSGVGKARWEPQLTLTQPAVPDVTWKDWTQPLDRFTSAYLAKQNVAEPGLVDPAEFARRAYLDIWGFLPTPEQMHEFLNSGDPDKRTKLVASLLDQPEKYSENWITWWNDLFRNDEGVTYYSETATRKSITTWLLDALQTNKPYDQMIRELMNPTTAKDPDGFLIGVNWRGTLSASQTPAMQASQNTAQIFLGINFKCNSCHDSFISKWKLKDSYALAAYFSAEDKLPLYRCDVLQEGQFATPAYMYPELDRALPSESIKDRRATIAAIFTDPRNGRVPRTFVNRVWAKLMGRGIVENVDDMDGEPWSPELLDWLAGDFVQNKYDIRHLITTIISSRTYQLNAVPNTGVAKEYTFRGPELRRLTAEEFADAIASVTGDWHVGRPRPAATPPPTTTTTPAASTGSTDAKPANDGAIAVFSGLEVDTDANLKQNTKKPTTPTTPPAGGRGATPSATPPAPPRPPAPIAGGEYTREWRIAGSNLTRALGRPIRDQVYTTRDTQATTIQAVELVNGETINHWLWRGAQRMLGDLPAEPASLFSRQLQTSGRAPTNPDSVKPGDPPPTPPPPPPAPVPFSIDISKSQKLYLIVEDGQSTAPDKATPIWLNSNFVTADGKRTPLSSLKAMDSVGVREDSSPVVPLGSKEAPVSALRVKFPSVLVYDISGRHFTKFEGAPALEDVPLVQGETVTARYFVFDQKPDMDRLAPPVGAAPLPAETVLKTVPETVDRVYWYLLGRAPSASERQIATAALKNNSHAGHPSDAGLADLMWSILMSPEFQYIR